MHGSMHLAAVESVYSVHTEGLRIVLCIFMHRYVWPTATTTTTWADTTTVHVALNRIIPFEIFPSYLFIVCILNLAVFMLHPKSRQVTWIDFDCKMHLFNRFYCIFTTHRAKKKHSTQFVVIERKLKECIRKIRSHNAMKCINIDRFDRIFRVADS